MSSANHDELRFTDADRFDIRRDNASEHLTFGYGAHQCMGKNMARLEMQVLLEEFTRRLPHLRLSEQRFTYLANTSFRGPEHFWVEWDPALNPERRQPALLKDRQPPRIGEPARQAITRRVRVESVRRAAEGIAVLRLVSVDGQPLPRWTPGAHIDVECGSPERSRAYSLCSDPDDEQAMDIAVLLEAQGRGGSAWIHAQVKAGDELKVRGPRNHFRLDESASRLIFIAGGIGITPVSTLARRAKALGIPYELHYAGRHRGSMAMLDELQALHGSRLQLYVGNEGTRLDLGRLLAQPSAGAQIYACGPQRMLQALEDGTRHWPDGALHVEHFVSTLGGLDPSREQAFEVELKDSGFSLQVRADQTLLEALRAANVDLQSDCREGLCGSCEVRVLSGPVDHRDRVLTRAERDLNQKMMSCCSRACGGQRLVLEL
jgi:ferredoxin-NADP reductase